MCFLCLFFFNKQLDDLIKQEETVINQTGSALEQCYHDSQFFGSIEHIECNRILLIACTCSTLIVLYRLNQDSKLNCFIFFKRPKKTIVQIGNSENQTEIG
jgi:hypothetical protein